MKTPSVVLVALTVSLAVGHLVEANNEPSVAKDLMRTLFGGVRRRGMASPHIAGGTEVKPHSHPHQVAILTSISEDHGGLCGGSLIAPQWILTAAHCVKEKNASVMAVMGAHDLKRIFEHGRQIIPSRRVLIFDNYDEVNVTDDIALIQLSTPATLNDKVNIIRLPSLRLAHTDLRHKSVEISGWGIYSRTNESSPFLRSAITNVEDNVICDFLYGQITSKMICNHGSRGQNVCIGDSGGPLVIKESDGEPTVIGVASFGSEAGCEAGHPTVFTRVDQYLGWIANHTGIELRK